MGKRKETKPKGVANGGSGMLAGVPMPAVGAAGVVIALAVLLPMMPKPAPLPARDIPPVPVCEKGVDFASAHAMPPLPQLDWKGHTSTRDPSPAAARLEGTHI